MLPGSNTIPACPRVSLSFNPWARPPAKFPKNRPACLVVFLEWKSPAMPDDPSGRSANAEIECWSPSGKTSVWNLTWSRSVASSSVPWPMARVPAGMTTEFFQKMSSAICAMMGLLLSEDRTLFMSLAGIVDPIGKLSPVLTISPFDKLGGGVLARRFGRSHRIML